MKTLRVVWAVVMVVAGAQACARTPEQEPPVATPEFSVKKTRAPLGSPMEVTYRFTVASGARFDQDYRVMVHFMDADEEMMWTYDHDPPVPTTRWTPGQTIEYTRTEFVPIYPYIGQATVQMGLYSKKDERRLPLTGEDRGQRSYKVATIELLPQSENVFLIYKDGWHPAEVAPDNAAVEWQWTKKEATVSFRNPKQDLLLYLHLDGRPDLFPEPQQIAVRVGEQTVETFPVADRREQVRKIPLPAAVLGSGEMVELKLQIDKTFVPAMTPGAGNTSDRRELGVRVFHMFVEPAAG